MKIEFILLGVILLIVLIDFLVKKRKKNSSNEIEEFEDFKNDNVKKPVILKWVLISLGVVSLGSLVVYQIVFAPKTYNTAEVTVNNNLAYLKSDMSLLNGKINDSLHKGEFVNGMKEGFHSIQYLYTGKDTLFSNAEGQFKNNTYIGEWLFYYPSGMLSAKGVYAGSNGESKGSSGVPNSEREGLWRFWHENGQLEREANYLNGKAEGLFRSWYENGQQSGETHYLNGKMEGLYRSWYKNGQLELEVNYLNGKAEGLGRLWHENGQLSEEGNYLNGKTEGLYRFWLENGQLSEEGNYLNGKKEGFWLFWDEKGGWYWRRRYSKGEVILLR